MGTEIADRTEAAAGIDAAAVVDALGEARERTLKLVESISDEELERVHSPLMSPLAWDLGHIAAFEDLWLVHRFGGKPLLHDDLADVYDAFETPRAGRGDLPFLRPSEARDYLAQTRDRTLETIAERGVADVHEMVIRHEHQHNETMLQTIQLARLEGYRLGTGQHPPVRTRRHSTAAADLDLVEIPAGRCTIGAGPNGFAYDNERPRHQTDVRAYLIGRTPITNASYLTFVEGGGYERREWWTDEGWAWKEEYDITRPGSWTADHESEWRLTGYQPLDPHSPVVHVSWFEADAFARAHGTRLPTEIEWEKAATWNQETARAAIYPWGDQPLVPGTHANVDHTSPGPQPVGGHPDGASAYGVHDLIGDVWEWTSSDFSGYPGFQPYPYREYSEVFFGSEYKVLRGGSWATRARVITPSFRNWDYPLRRQIFAGFRIAKDLQP